MDEQELTLRIDGLERSLQDMQGVLRPLAEALPAIQRMANQGSPVASEITTVSVKITLAAPQYEFLDRLRDQVYRNSGRKPQRGKVLGILLDAMRKSGLDLSEASNLEEIADTVCRICDPDFRNGHGRLFDDVGRGG